MTTHLILILSNTKKNLSHWGQAVERNVRASWEAFFFCGHERMSHRQMKKEMKRPLLWGTQWRPGNDVPEVWFLLETFDTPKSYPKIAKIIIIFSGSWRFFLLGPAHISPGILMAPPSVAWTLARLFIPGWLEDFRCTPLRDVRGSSTGGRKQLVYRALLKSSSVSFYKISAEPHFCVKQDNFSAGSMGFELGTDAMCSAVERYWKWALPAEGFSFNNLVFSLQFLWAQSENFCQPGL